MWRVIRGQNKRLAVVNFAPRKRVLFESDSRDEAIAWAEWKEIEQMHVRDVVMAVSLVGIGFAAMWIWLA